MRLLHTGTALVPQLAQLVCNNNDVLHLTRTTRGSRKPMVGVEFVAWLMVAVGNVSGWWCWWLLVGGGLARLTNIEPKCKGERKIHRTETRHEGQISGCNTLSRNAGAIIIPTASLPVRLPIAMKGKGRKDEKKQVIP